MNIELLKASVRQHEDERLFPYVDTKGKVTIGVGHNLTDRGIPKGISEALFSLDIAEAVSSLGARYPWTYTLSDVRQRVLTEMLYNMGLPQFSQFRRMLRAAQDGDVETAAAEMLDSQWAKDVGGRATRLATMYQTGKDPGE
jgi:lysozyme